MASWQPLSLAKEQIVTGFDAEIKGTKEPLAEEVGVQMTPRGRYASRSGAGIPPVTFQDVGARLYRKFDSVSRSLRGRCGGRTGSARRNFAHVGPGGVSPDRWRAGFIEPPTASAEKSSPPGRTNRRGVQGGCPARAGFARRGREDEAMCVEFPAHPRGDRQSWGGG